MENTGAALIECCLCWKKTFNGGGGLKEYWRKLLIQHLACVASYNNRHSSTLSHAVYIKNSVSSNGVDESTMSTLAQHSCSE